MSDTDRLKQVVSNYLDQVGRVSLEFLLFDVINPEDLDQFLARMSYHVAPSYLPFATYDGSLMVVHLWPGREIEDSPVLFVPSDAREARFVCSRQSKLPQALFLWVGRYLTNRADELRQALESLAESIPGAQAVEDELWSTLEQSPSWWLPGSGEQTNHAWDMADVGHPFAGAPKFSRNMPPEEAFALLEPFVASRPDVPELLSVLLATKRKLNIPQPREDVLKVLSAEAWRELRCVMDGNWRQGGEGMCEWDCTLSNLADPEATLQNTPFEGLVSKSGTYSGEDRTGAQTLLNVSRAFNDAGDKEGELRQTRNSATLAVLRFGEYPDALARKISEVCDDIEPDSLAGAVGREVARVHQQGP